MVKFLKNLHIGLIAKEQFFQIKKLNESNFFLIIIYILIKFKVFIYIPWKFIWSTDIQNTLLLVYWPPHGIAIDHSSIGLKSLTIQLVFIEAWLCVVMRFLHHNTSQVCTATLNVYKENFLQKNRNWLWKRKFLYTKHVAQELSLKQIPWLIHWKESLRLISLLPTNEVAGG